MRWLFVALALYAGAILWLDRRVNNAEDAIARYKSWRFDMKGTRTESPAGEKEQWFGLVDYVDSRYGLWEESGTTDRTHEWKLQARYEDGLRQRRETFPDGRYKPRASEWAEGIEEGFP